MMKQIMLLIAFAGLSFGAFGKDLSPDKSDGCGLGWNVYKDKTILGTSIRATTNYVAPPSFSMSSGTSNCEHHSVVKADKVQEHFTNVNYDSLVADMASGQGEFVSEYASLFGCQDYAQFGEMTQKNFSEIVPSDDSAGSMIQNVREQIKTNGLNCAV